MTKQKRPTPRDDARREPKANTDDVASLINERRKFEDWIAALEAKRAETPGHVYTRVHADYEARLQSVVEKLASHTSSLGNEVAGLKRKLDKIDDEIGHGQDERAEIELRSDVGELDSAEVTEALRAADDGLAHLAASRKAVEADLVRVTEFFAAAGGGPAPSVTPPRLSRASFDELSFLHSVVGERDDEKKPAESRPKAKPDLARESPKAASAPPATPPQRTGERLAERPVVKPPEKTAETAAETTAETIAEKAVEKVVVEKALEVAVAKPADKPVEPVAEESVESVAAKPAEEKPPEKSVATAGGLGIEKETDSLADKPPQRETRPSIVMQQMSQTIEPEDVPRTSIGIVKAGESVPSLLDGILPTAPAGEKPFAANVVSNSPLSLKSSAKGDVKTLKCRECGTMNDPTEWYCERCGAELSAM